MTGVQRVLFRSLDASSRGEREVPFEEEDLGVFDEELGVEEQEDQTQNPLPEGFLG